MTPKAPKDGGQAFPCGWSAATLPGMSQRDYFAAAALNRCFVAAPQVNDYGYYTESELNRYAYRMADQAYRIADAMLAERDRDGSTG